MLLSIYKVYDCIKNLLDTKLTINDGKITIVDATWGE